MRLKATVGRPLSPPLYYPLSPRRDWGWERGHPTVAFKRIAAGRPQMTMRVPNHNDDGILILILLLLLLLLIPLLLLLIII